MPIILKPGREKSLLRRHPWVFSGAIRDVDKEGPLRQAPPAGTSQDIASGSTVDLFSSDGQFLARASYSPRSQIRARVWTFDDEPVDKEFFRQKIRASLVARHSFLSPQDTDAYRLIYAESDGIPGLVVDRYGEMLVLQSLTAGSEFWKETFADLLLEETGLKDIYERSDADVRELEGLPAVTGTLRGSPTTRLPIMEHGLKFLINFESGHKTGFYLDQRANRQHVRQLVKDKDVLDCFSYTGGFSLHALSGGARSVLSVDASADALALCKENVLLNDLPSDRHSTLEGDVFHLLRKFRDEARSFDMIILDPPKFAPTAAQVDRAARAYKDINLLAFKLLRPGGILITFSCSGGVDAALFQKIIAGAALDAGVEAQIVEHLSQGPDHPVHLNFPESMYLKGLVCLKR